MKLLFYENVKNESNTSFLFSPSDIQLRRCQIYLNDRYIPVFMVAYPSFSASKSVNFPDIGFPADFAAKMEGSIWDMTSVEIVPDEPGVPEKSNGGFSVPSKSMKFFYIIR